MVKENTMSNMLKNLIVAPISGDVVNGNDGESMIVDSREGVRPAEMVERKLIALLRGSPMSVSQIQKSVRKR